MQGKGVALKSDCKSFYGPKLNSNNEVIIHNEEEKMYSREEMAEQLKMLYYEGLTEITNGKSLDKWIEKNL